VSEEIHGQFGLLSLQCECGRVKLSGQSFCRTCYRALPIALRRPLYRRMGAGYEEALDAARRFLKGDDVSAELRGADVD
jgi:hypothetical protein